MTTPAVTEAEIRDLVGKGLGKAIDGNEIAVGDWIGALIDPIRYNSPADFPEGVADMRNRVWTNLRPTEVDRLEELIDGIYAAGDRLTLALAGEVAELVVAAVMTFAAEYPDAPRAVREPVTA